MRHRLMNSLLIGVVGTTMSVGAFADDLNAPEWRGQPLSVFAEWEWVVAPGNLFFMPPDAFSVTSGTADPDVGPNGESLYQGFQTHAEVDSASNWAWVPGDGDGGLQAVAPGASIGFKVQNWIDLEPEKWLRIQVTYIGEPPPSILSADGYFEPSGDESIGVRTGFFEGDGYFYEDWRIVPNPEWDLIAIGVPQGVILDQVVIDTISIPGPATLATIALAMPLMVRRRR